MRTMTTIFIYFISYQLLFSCSCEAPPSLCTYSKQIESDSDGAIFIGVPIQTDSVDEFHYAVQFKVEEMFRGSIVPGISTFFTNENYENTDSTLWILGGQSSLCSRELEERALIVMKSYEEGYISSICRNDYFEIDDEGMISGTIYDSLTWVTVSINEIENIIQETCTSSVEDLQNDLAASISIMPNPVIERLIIKNQSTTLRDVRYQVYDILGYEVRSGVLDKIETSVDLSSLPQGMYFLSFTKQRAKHTIKIAKARA